MWNERSEKLGITINNKMKYFRTKAGLTQEDVAKKLQVVVSAYNQLENSKRNISLVKAKQLENIFHASINDIFFGN